ncbi:PD-(D/E)XK nuclease family protein [uncultured Brachyspira sp.]|uniref:PDDEXK-like family protein n=1 Tax=uncultured Brachyspira sp. TaxID=221953 RepID=UPI0027DE6209|nr:PD-(D/E)XK nuclease family protein [uncultured Brachyspira sp.]
MAKSLTKKENILLTLINAFQNDEKEKLNHLVNISKSLIEVREKVKEEMEKLPPQFNVFNSINLLNHKNYNSNLFANFLEVKFKYNDNEISFAKLFLKYLTEEFGWEFDLENIKIKDIEIKRELPTEERKRIDIFIGYKEKFAVIIENKIWADDGYKQLENYYNYVKSQKYDKIYMIYLTPYEREPSEESLSKELYKEKGSKLYGKFANIRHAEIGYWLEGILKRQEFSFLNNEEENNKKNYKLLKSALIQIIDNEKSISGENEEGDMTETEIKKVLKENLFKEIKTIEKADEYIDMFNKANELLEEHRNLIVKKQISTFLNFTKEVAKKLEKQSYKKGDAPDKDTYCICDDNHVIEHGCHWLGLGELIFLQANYDNSMIYHFGVCVGKNDIKMKRKIKKLQETIKNIFDFEYHENSDEWILDYNQNIENENPKKIAEVMIKLYELLKKEIK